MDYLTDVDEFQLQEFLDKTVDLMIQNLNDHSNSILDCNSNLSYIFNINFRAKQIIVFLIKINSEIHFKFPWTQGKRKKSSNPGFRLESARKNFGCLSRSLTA